MSYKTFLVICFGLLVPNFVSAEVDSEHPSQQTEPTDQDKGRQLAETGTRHRSQPHDPTGDPLPDYDEAELAASLARVRQALQALSRPSGADLRNRKPQRGGEPYLAARVTSSPAAGASNVADTTSGVVQRGVSGLVAGASMVASTAYRGLRCAARSAYDHRGILLLTTGVLATLAAIETMSHETDLGTLSEEKNATIAQGLAKVLGIRNCNHDYDWCWRHERGQKERQLMMLERLFPGFNASTLVGDCYKKFSKTLEDHLTLCCVERGNHGRYNCH